MKAEITDILIVGAGPVGLMCAYLARRCGLKVQIIDQSSGPLTVGRADALNARSLQGLKQLGLLADLYPLGKACNTSSIWANGRFVSRQSSWWEALEGCQHRHFLMLGQSHLEQLLDQKLMRLGAPVQRHTSMDQIQLNQAGCLSQLSDGRLVQSRFLIGADGSRSFVRDHFKIPFAIERPQLIWAVIDAVIETDFPKVPEIIVFQAETADVAWIPREGNLDRFYVRMDRRDFNLEEALAKVKLAMQPHQLAIKELIWFSRFSVKESVAANFSIQNRVFLAGDAAHIHSVNGGQGLNTGLGDAFNLIWKLNQVIQGHATSSLLATYEQERKPVATHIVETAAALVRATKYSQQGTHAQDYVRLVEQNAGNITGMGIRYGQAGLAGMRLYDFELRLDGVGTWIYAHLNYHQYTLLLFGKGRMQTPIPANVRLIEIPVDQQPESFFSSCRQYLNQAILVRPDAYIQAAIPMTQLNHYLQPTTSAASASSP